MQPSLLMKSLLAQCATRLTIIRPPVSPGIEKLDGSPLLGSPSPKRRAKPLPSPSLSAQRSPLRRHVNLGPADEAAAAPNSLGLRPGSSPASEPQPLSRLPTHVKSQYEINQEVRKMHETMGTTSEDGTPEGRALDLPSPRTASGYSSASTGLPTPVLEPLQLQQLDDDIHLPFADRDTEILELLTQPGNAALLSSLKRLDGGTLWPELERLVSQTRQEMGDEVLVQDANALIAPHGSRVWIQFRGLIGADHLVASPVRPTTSPVVEMTPVARDEPVFRRTRSFDSNVFFSDTESCLSMPPDEPHDRPGSVASGQLSPLPLHSPHHDPFGGSPLKHVTIRAPPSPSAQYRHHTRTASHGGAIAYPHPSMESIQEDADPEESGTRRGTSLDLDRRPNEWSSSNAAASLGLRITTTADGASDSFQSQGTDPSIERAHTTPRRRSSRYSFGSVNGQGLGLTA